MLRDAITQAMKADVVETVAIRSKLGDVGTAIGAVTRGLIGVMPQMRRAGRTDVGDLTVSLNALTPVSEPLCAVA